MTRTQFAIARKTVISIEACSFCSFLNLLCGLVAVVRIARFKQFVRSGNMLCCIGGLEIRSFKMRVVAVDSDPCKRVNNSLGPLRFVTRFVGVFNAQYEGAIVLQCKEPVIERRPCAANVKITGGRWRETITRSCRHVHSGYLSRALTLSEH